jgi:hypothetical protein
LSNGSSFNAPVNWSGSGNRGKGWHIGDFNGDGKDDIFRYVNQYGGAEVLLSNGSSFNAPVNWSGSGNRGKGWHIGDFNGDGKDDIFRYVNQYGGAEVLLAKKYANLYFGNQDNGTYSSTNAIRNPPSWLNKQCCDGFDVAADHLKVLYTVCCGGGTRRNHLYLREPGMEDGDEVNTYPPGDIPGWRPTNNIVQFGEDDFAVITTLGVFITQNINANPIVWTEIGAATIPNNPCGIKVGISNNTPIFYVQSPQGNLQNDDQLWSYVGTDAGGNWNQINPPGAIGGFNVYDIDPNDPDRILACHLRPALDPQMVFSDDGGANWTMIPALDNLLTGAGVFNYENRRGPTNFTGFFGYPQPCLIALDPYNSDIMLVGGVDAGIFISIDGGTSWDLLTDPLTPHTSGIPHIPRPQFAYFFHDVQLSDYDDIIIFIGSQGRGIWRINLRIPH